MFNGVKTLEYYKIYSIMFIIIIYNTYYILK